jgi:hypothetical protein
LILCLIQEQRQGGRVEGQHVTEQLVARLRPAFRPPQVRAWLLLVGEVAWLIPLLLLFGWLGRLTHWEPAFNAT